VTYGGTRATDTFTTKRAALDQARFAVSIGNSRSCVEKKGVGGWLPVTCVTRRKRRKGR
jgi:hypothetical protein